MIQQDLERVVLYVEPHADAGKVTQDTVRTQVKIDGRAFPWERYAAEFQDRMPSELTEFQEQIAAGAQHRDHSATVRERLADVADLFQIPRYKPSPDGEQHADDPHVGGEPGDLKPQRKQRRQSGPRGGGTAGNVHANGGRPQTFGLRGW